MLQNSSTRLVELVHHVAELVDQVVELVDQVVELVHHVVELAQYVVEFVLRHSSCSVSRWRPHEVDKRMVLVHTHGLFIT
jgi:hypothetical protein